MQRLIRRTTGALIAMALLVCGAAGVVQAATIDLAYEVTGFVPLLGSTTAPQDPVSGSIVYESLSDTNFSPVSLTSVSMTIMGHSYTVGELGFNTTGGINTIIYGLLNGQAIYSGTDDFWLQFNWWTPSGLDFAYTTPAIPAVGAWNIYGGAGQFTKLTLTPRGSPPAVPLPASGLLAGLGLLALLFFRHRHSS